MKICKQFEAATILTHKKAFSFTYHNLLNPKVARSFDISHLNQYIAILVTLKRSATRRSIFYFA